MSFRYIRASWGVLGCPGVSWGGFRDSSAQNHFGPGLLGPNRFFTGTPRPGTPRPSYKNALLWHIVENKRISSVFFISI